MKYFSFLLSIIFLFSCKIKVENNYKVSNHSFSNLDEVRFGKLDWTAKVDFEKKKIIAVAKWKFKQLKPTENMVVDINDLKIDSIKLNHRKVDFIIGEKHSYLGSPLSFKISKDDTVVEFFYETAVTAQALQWLSPQQTTDKKMPYLFTQCESINTRSIIPCQDNPANRITYTATVTVPKGMMAVMSANNPKQRNETGVYNFDMDIPIPTYLIALAVGDIDFKAIDERTGIFAEPSILQKAANELNDIPKMVSAAEKLAGPYRWGRYDVLIQPASFPIGGMENPKLTFATPTILAGDKSLVSLVAHELAHSWSGNTVTNASWDDLWLNEGFTTYFERRIMESLTDTNYVNMLWELSYQDMMLDINDFGKDNVDTKLKLDLKNRDPEDAFSNIPYEKGAHLLWLMDKTIGRKTFDTFLVNYFNDNAFMPMTTEMALTYMDKNLFAKNKDWKNIIGIDEWIFKTGIPANCPRPDMTRFNKVDSIREAFLKNNSIEKSITQNWTTHEWLHFLRRLPLKIDTAKLLSLDKAFNLTYTTNSEIAFEWFMHCIPNNYSAINTPLDAFLSRVGRKKFVKPLYQAIFKNNKNVAIEIFNKYKANYHPKTRDAIELVLK